MAINFIGALNAVQKLYADKTNLMVPVGCGEDTPPTPPTPSVVESVTFYAVQNTPSECLDFMGYETSCYATYTTLTLNQSWFNENINDIGQINVLINDDNDQEIYSTIFFPSSINVFNDEGAVEGTLPEMPESGPYSITVYSNDLTPLYEGTGTWTYEAPTGPVISNVVVTQQAEDTYLITADSSMDIRDNYVVEIQCEGMSYPVELDGFEDGIHLNAMLFEEVIPFVNGGTWTTAITNQTTMEYEPEQTGTYTYIPLT